MRLISIKANSFFFFYPEQSSIMKKKVKACEYILWCFQRYMPYQSCSNYFALKQTFQQTCNMKHPVLIKKGLILLENVRVFLNRSNCYISWMAATWNDVFKRCGIQQLNQIVLNWIQHPIMVIDFCYNTNNNL